MKLALIPPFCFAGYMQQTDYQLVLPECFRDENYTKTVYELRQPDQYLILDNGAAEGDAWHPAALLAIAKEFKLDEIVIPDVLFEMQDTLDLLDQFRPYATPEYKYMGVLQGKTLGQVLQCAAKYAEAGFVDTFGIPRHMIDTLGDKNARITIAETITEICGDEFDVHFLGASPSWPMEASVLGKAVPWARGLDTSLPFVAAYYGFELDALDMPAVARPVDYFNCHPAEFGQIVLDYNVSVLRGWLNG